MLRTMMGPIDWKESLWFIMISRNLRPPSFENAILTTFMFSRL